jgi:hypothetical protein
LYQRLSVLLEEVKIMEKLAIHLKSLPGQWINKESCQKVQIHYHIIDTYIAQYDPPLFLGKEAMEIKEEEIKIIPLSYRDFTCKLTNSYGSWTLEFISTDEVIISNNPDINLKPIICAFVRIKPIR